MDPSVSRALRLLVEWSRRVQGRSGRPAPASNPDKVVDELAGRLMAEELPRYGWLDVGLWGRAVYRRAVAAALRVRTVAITGDEYPL
jgi:hypothetical protein